MWNCHHCQWSGGVIDKIDFDRQSSKVRQTSPAPAPMVVQTGENDKMIQWFATRGISASTIARAGVIRTETWMPGCERGETVPVVVFPYYRGGEVVNHKYRAADKRFRQDKGAEKVFFGLDLCQSFDEVIIVEGEIDALSIREVDMPNVLSVPDGAPKQVKEGPIDPENDTKFSYLWNCRDELKSVTKFIIATDADGPGQALAEELARRLGRDKCWRVIWPEGCKDANEVLVQHGKDALIDCIEAAKPWPITGLYGVDDYRDEVIELYRNGRKRAFSTGWGGLDQFLTITEGQLSVVTGIPNSGKSEWVDALMVNLAEANGWNFAVCSFENPPVEHISKLVEKHLRTPYWDGAMQRMTEVQLQSGMDWVRDHFHFIRADGDGDMANVDWILEKMAACVLRYGVKGVVLDPWNECEHQRPANMSETEYIGHSLMKIKRFASTRGVHVWIVAHPSKMHAEGGKVPIPGLYDISGSSNWANKADLGVVVHRNDEDQNVEIHVKKCRFKSIGRKGVSCLNYDRVTGRYYETRGEG